MKKYASREASCTAMPGMHQDTFCLAYLQRSIEGIGWMGNAPMRKISPTVAVRLDLGHSPLYRL